MQAASTMNQSDIRGLLCWQQCRADIDIIRREPMLSTLASSVGLWLTYRIGCVAYGFVRACT